MFKLVATLVLAMGSVIAAIVESRHPLLFSCLVLAFVCGASAAEALRAHRNRTVRSVV